MNKIIDKNFHEIDSSTFYEILRLRVDVFVVEQNCPYPELDGLDLATSTRHIWIANNDVPISYLRLINENENTNRISRVATSVNDRGKGLAKTLVEYAISTTSGLLTLDAQTYLENWYMEMGFVANGETFEECCGQDTNPGIPHVPMIHKRKID